MSSTLYYSFDVQFDEPEDIDRIIRGRAVLLFAVTGCCDVTGKSGRRKQFPGRAFIRLSANNRDFDRVLSRHK